MFTKNNRGLYAFKTAHPKNKKVINLNFEVIKDKKISGNEYYKLLNYRFTVYTIWLEAKAISGLKTIFMEAIHHISSISWFGEVCHI